MLLSNMYCSYLLVNKTKKSNANLHAKVMKAENGGLQENETSSEEKAQSQGQVVSLLSLWRMEWIEGSNNASRKLRLHSL